MAGAGSGKTTVLINRIANILRYGDAYNSTYLRDDLDENDIAACKAYIENGTPLTTETQEHLSVSCHAHRGASWLLPSQTKPQAS